MLDLSKRAGIILPVTQVKSLRTGSPTCKAVLSRLLTFAGAKYLGVARVFAPSAKQDKLVVQTLQLMPIG
jgi:hypothetical protein